MGTLLTVRCPKCGYEERLSVGAGIRFNKLENILGLFDERSQRIISSAVSLNPQSIWSVTNNIATCNHCKKITTVAVFKTEDRTGKEMTVCSRCQCGGMVNLEDMDKAIENKVPLACPKCRTGLAIETTGNWD